MARGFDDIDPTSGGNKDAAKMEEIVQTCILSKDARKQWLTIRFLNHDMLPVKTHWIKILAGKDKREVKIPKLCVSFDADNERTPLKGVTCKYCTLSQGKDATCQTSTQYYINGIIRDLQASEPKKAKKASKLERKTGFIDIDSDTWTPVRAVRLPSSLASKIRNLGKINKVKNKKTKETKTYPVTHPKFGRDISIFFDPDTNGTDAYQINMEDGRTPLDEDEAKYLVWDLNTDMYPLLGLEDEKEANKKFKEMTFVGENDLEDDDDDEDDDSLELGKSKKKKKKKRPVYDDDDEDDDDIPF